MTVQKHSSKLPLPLKRNEYGFPVNQGPEKKPVKGFDDVKWRLDLIEERREEEIRKYWNQYTGDF